MAISSCTDGKMEAVHHKFQWRLLEIKMRNEDIRKKRGLWKLELIIAELRLRWLENVWRTPEFLVGLYSGNWGGTRGSWWTTKNNWMDIVRWDLKDMGTTRDETEELVTNRAEWCQRVAQCIHLHAVWTKVGLQVEKGDYNKQNNEQYQKTANCYCSFWELMHNNICFIP